MSRAYASVFMKKRFPNLDWEKAAYKVSGSIRYSVSKDTYEIECLDCYEFVYGHNIKKLRAHINEYDLYRMIQFDLDGKKWKKTEETEDLVYRQLSDKEMLELDDDTFNGISVCQYFYRLTPRVLELAKRQAHLYKLGRLKTPRLELSKRQFHTNGGRKVGSRNHLTEEERERIQYCKDNFERIKENCLRHNWWDEYQDLHKTVGKKAVFQTYMDEKTDYFRNKTS